MKHMASRLPGPIHKAEHILRSGLEVFMPFYHAVSNQVLPHTLHLYAPRSLAQFETDLDYLGRYFEPVRMREFLAGEISGNSKKPPMVLSLDDGLIECHQEIMPLLLKKGIPATFFLNNDFIDNKELFFRFKVSLLLEQLPGKSKAEIQAAAKILQCAETKLRKGLLGISYAGRELCEQIAKLWSYSFEEFLSENPVYLSTRQINEMKEQGFEFGAHGFDHPQFSLLSARESLEHIRQSVEDLQIRFVLDYRYFAFPFTDFGVQDSLIEDLFRLGVMDAGFGTAGLKEDKWKRYYQRVPMEINGLDARHILRGELTRRMLRRMLGKNHTVR